ncbi:diguanylate cyclase [Desulfosarcina sp.]|uniref:diguanylate cyclase n=1 Tax=Desulfosarcina sp. TaxID=2027861 RepID=UPI0029ABAC04|nr:diguanylate cyclase [Desulfosarcina sp.]MDX2454101.1 diguanylate cyclase [Desulfosarcina sp.]MDX2491783.1 diguanylate cyclase [Desulfosarcina sp.]
MRFTTEKIKLIIQVLEQAVSEHRGWLNDWHRSLIFGQPLASTCFLKDSYRKCGFGQWYYSQSSPILSDHSVFILIGQIHRDLHNKAFVLADKIKHYGTISIKDYDFFIAKEQDFSKKIFDLRDELREVLFEIDPLTDIFNRQAFFRILSYEYERASRTGQPCCICMVDLDHFKAINDTYGHLVGDRVLRAVAHYLTGKLRPYDSMCRYGGEEFLICLPNTKLDKAKKIVNRLRIGLLSLPIDLDNDKQVKITASFGIAKMAINITINDNIIRADEALYAAKYGGRNQAIAYEEIRPALKNARRNVK